MTWVWIYAATWGVTTAIAFVASRRLGERTRPVMDSFMLSVLAGALWPFLVVGVAELSSVAAYSTAETWLVAPDPEGLLDDVVVNLR
jgi:hypothetical protein